MGTACLVVRITIEDKGLHGIVPCLSNVDHQGREMSCNQPALSDPKEIHHFLLWNPPFYVPQFVVDNIFSVSGSGGART